MKEIPLEELEENDLFDCEVYSDDDKKLADPFTKFDSERLQLLDSWSVDTIKAESDPLTPEQIKAYKKKARQARSARNVSDTSKIFESDDPVAEGLIDPADDIRETLISRVNKSYKHSLNETRQLLKPLSQNRINDVDKLYNAIRVVFEAAWEYPLPLLYKMADSDPVEGEEYIFKFSLHTSMLAVFITQQMGLGETEARRVGLAGLVHDLGMFKIPQHIRKNSGDLTDEQFEMVQTHPIRGAKMLKQFDRLETSVKRVAAEHHEQVDGSGYPAGTTSEDLHDHSKIVNLAMAYVAMTQPRKHRGSMAARDAVIKIVKQERDQYDNRVVKAFLQKVGLYPPGSFVKLDSGHHALVLESDKSSPSKPKLKVFTNGEGYTLDKPFEMKLTECDRKIVDVLENKELGYTALDVA